MKFFKNKKVLIIFAAILITTTNFVINAAQAQSCTCAPFFCAGSAELCFDRCYLHDGCDFCWLWGSWCTNCTMWAQCGSAWECYCIDSYTFRHTCYEETGECWG
jgi:hypothetical protein